MTTSSRRGQNLWFDSDGAFTGAAWYWPQAGAPRSTAVVIVAGMAHEERSMASGLVALAESLADAGLAALLFDLHGCSQSAGRLDEPEIGERWRANVRAAVARARAAGFAQVIVVGVRLGATIAFEALADEPLAALVAWAPVVTGRRHVRELKVLQRTTDAGPGGLSIAIGGFSIPAPVLEHVAKLDLLQLAGLRTARVLLLDETSGLNAPWLARLAEQGVQVEELESTQIQPWLFGAGDQPEIPGDDIQCLARWCRAAHDAMASASDAGPARPALSPSVSFTHQGRSVRETFVEIGPNGLTGVLSEPAVAPAGTAVRLLMSTVGPGRTFTDFARDEASRGHSSLRFDFAGFGTSGRGESIQGGELYTDEGGRDVTAAIDHLRRAGHERVFMLGFCAGAWSMMQAGVRPEVRASVAINVALYRQPGVATVELVHSTRQKLAKLSPALARNSLLRWIAARVRRTATERREPVEWLTKLCASDIRVMLAYAELDPGLNYLNGQMANGLREQLRKPFALQTYAGLGHLAEGPTARARVFRDITDFFASLDREEAAVQASPRRQHAHAPTAALGD
ncbi:MAG TPA: hypothetical protein VGM74_13925 [Burkholderiaceae bacterium]|jgi:dienelactone hydrolase